ncbi:hypothetical protein, partial [Staphylococcus warneri]
KKMSSLNMFLAPATTISSTTTTTSISPNTTTTTSMTTTRARRVQTFATASKGGSGKSSEEQGFFEWLVGALEKKGFSETDPILQKVEEKSGTTGKSGTTTISGKKTNGSAPAPPKKSGGNGGFPGLGGLFAKK